MVTEHKATFHWPTTSTLSGNYEVWAKDKLIRIISIYKVDYENTVNIARHYYDNKNNKDTCLLYTSPSPRDS